MSLLWNQQRASPDVLMHQAHGVVPPCLAPTSMADSNETFFNYSPGVNPNHICSNRWGLQVVPEDSAIYL